MLLTIHNLPATIRYGDIKGLLQSKCGLQNVILDNLVADGNCKKVTVGVSEDADAAILTRKINGLYWNGQQLYVEDVRQRKTKSEQPYRSANPQVLQKADEFPNLNLQQNSSYDTGMLPNMNPGVQPMLAMYCAPGYNQVYGLAGSNEQMQNVQTAYMGMGGYPQNSMLMSQLGMTPQSQPLYQNQQDSNQSNVGNNWDNSYDQPPEEQSLGRSTGFNQGFKRQQSPLREQPWTRGSDGHARNDFDVRPVPKIPYAKPWNESEEPIPQNDPSGRRPERPNERFSNRSNDRPVEFPRQPDDWQGRNDFSESNDRPGISFEYRSNDFSSERPKRNEFSERQDVRQRRPNESSGSIQFGKPTEFSSRSNDRQGQLDGFFGRSNERQGRPNDFSGRPNERQGRPSEFSGRPNERQGKPNEFSGRPNERQGRPNEFSGRPYERQGRPNEFSGRPNERQGRPNEFSGRPNERQGRPNEFSGRPNERQGRPNDYYGRPNERQDRSNDLSGRKNERQVRPNEFSERRNDRQGRQNVFSGLANERQGRSIESSGRPNIRQGRPNQFSGQPNERQGRPNEWSGPPNKRANRSTEPSRSVLSKRPKFDHSAERPAFASRGKPNPISADPPKKRRMDRPDAVVVEESRPLTIESAQDPNDEELSEAAKEKISKQLRKHGAKKVIYELYSSLGIEDPDLITRQAVNKFIISRLDELVGDTLLVSPLECYDIYRNRYPSTDDAAAFAQISAIIATTREKEDIATKTAVTVKPPVSRNAPKPAYVPPPPGVLSKGEKQTLRRIKEAKARLAEGRIPTFPMGDKQVMTQQKQEQKAGYIPEAEPQIRKAVDEEVAKVIKLFTDELRNGPTADVQRAYNTVDQEELVDDVTQNVTQTLTRRVTNHGLKMIRVFGHPKLPKRPALEQFLTPFGVVSLRKSQRSKLYTAAVDTFKQYDKLLTMGDANIGDGITLSFKPLHLVTKRKADQKQLRILRKEMTDKMIDYSELNLLDKDWPAKEIKINAALEALKAQKQAEYDEKRALEQEKCAQENKDKDIENNKAVDSDDKTTLDFTDDVKVAEDYIGEDFEVIDEVNELDDENDLVDYSIDNFDVDIDDDDDNLEDY